MRPPSEISAKPANRNRWRIRLMIYGLWALYARCKRGITSVTSGYHLVRFCLSRCLTIRIHRKCHRHSPRFRMSNIHDVDMAESTNTGGGTMCLNVMVGGVITPCHYTASVCSSVASQCDRGLASGFFITTVQHTKKEDEKKRSQTRYLSPC